MKFKFCGGEMMKYCCYDDNCVKCVLDSLSINMDFELNLDS